MAILEALKAYADKHMPGCEWRLIEGYRSAAYQRVLYNKGRSTPPLGTRHIVTFRDGYRRRSNHQSGLAADIAPVKDGKVWWSCPHEHWSFLGHLARANGLTWGGDWEKLRDMPHIEWP